MADMMMLDKYVYVIDETRLRQEILPSFVQQPKRVAHIVPTSAGSTDLHYVCQNKYAHTLQPKINDLNGQCATNPENSPEQLAA